MIRPLLAFVLLSGCGTTDEDSTGGDGSGDALEGASVFYTWSGSAWESELEAAPDRVGAYDYMGYGRFIGSGDTVYEWDDASGWSAYTDPAPGAITGMQYMGYGLFVGVGDTVYEWDDGAGTWNSYTDAAPATIGGLQYNGYGLFVSAGTSIGTPALRPTWRAP